MEEEWRDIIGYKGLYKISNIGNVFSYHKNKMLEPWGKRKSGYTYLNLTKQGVCKSFRRGRLVAKHFISNPKRFPCINHINGKKWDDRVSNLEWCTYKQNMRHAVDTGLYTALPATKNGNSRLNKTQVKAIRKEKGKITCRELAEKYNVTNPTICNVWNKKTYSTIK